MTMKTASVPASGERAPSSTPRVLGRGPKTGDTPAEARMKAAMGLLRRLAPSIAWWIVSVGVFGGLWEAAWALGWANPLLLPPPHIFLQNFAQQGRYAAAAATRDLPIRAQIGRAHV